MPLKVALVLARAKLATVSRRVLIAGLGLVFAAGLTVAGANAADAGRRKTSRKGSSAKKTKPTRSVRSCLKALDALGVKYSRVKRRGIAIGVRVRGELGGITYKSYSGKALILDCSLVVSLAASGSFLVDQGIDRATYSSAYQIRNVRGTRRRSRHSFGLAIDVHSYSGPQIGTLRIKDDYEQGLGDTLDCIGLPLTDGGRILRAVNCQLRRSGLLKNILDPDYDGDHYNHFHMSARAWRERSDDALAWQRRAALSSPAPRP